MEEFYIGGAWVKPKGGKPFDVINPATEKPFAKITLGTVADVDAAAGAARGAFDSFSATTREERMALLDRVIEVYQAKSDALAEAVSNEMGAPLWFAQIAQVPAGLMHLTTARKILEEYSFETQIGSTLIAREPIGACGMITPWNWPLNQITCKVAPALATGCTMVLKPSEIAPLSGMLFAEVLHEAGVPAGVFNLVNGDGPTVGAAISSHPDLDMVSFTGSTRAGVEVARGAASTIKRVAQELGGKSANILLDDVDFEKAVPRDVMAVMYNSGQSCNAPTRMLVPHAMMDKVAEIATAAANAVTVGNPRTEGVQIGPVISEAQWKKIQGLIQKGLDNGARLAAGGLGKPEGLETGYYVKPTIFSHVTNDMTIAREEIFGPVLVLIGYEDEADAIRIANESDYGLGGNVSSADITRARRVAKAMRTGMVHINGAGSDFDAPFGGYKQSGNGREWGAFGFEDFLETKAIMGWG